MKGAFVFPHKEVKEANKDSHFLAVLCAAQAQAGGQMRWANTHCGSEFTHTKASESFHVGGCVIPACSLGNGAPLAAVSGWTFPFLLSGGKQQRRGCWEQALVFLVYWGPSSLGPISNSTCPIPIPSPAAGLETQGLVPCVGATATELE